MDEVLLAHMLIHVHMSTAALALQWPGRVKSDRDNSWCSTNSLLPTAACFRANHNDVFIIWLLLTMP